LSNDSRKSCLELLVETERERERERVRVSRREGFELLVETERRGRGRGIREGLFGRCVCGKKARRGFCVCAGALDKEK